MPPRPPATRSCLAAGAALVLTLLLVACGGDDDGPSASDLPSATDGSVELVDGLGRTITLDAPATKVVALEWTYAEDLLALGVTPLGVADVDGYAGWVASPPLPDGVTDVGTRQEPSIERMLALDPDLIVSAGFRHEAILDQLEGIAPTLLFDPYPTDGDHLEEMRATVATLADAVGRPGVGDEVLAALDARIAEVSATLEEAGLAGTPVAVAQGALQQGTPILRVFTAESMVARLLAEAGLVDAWDGPRSAFGYSTVDLEALTRLPDDATLLTIAQPVSDPFTDAFAGNPLWEAMPMVADGRVHPLGGDTWTYGGPLSAEKFLDRAVQALAP